MLDLTRDLIQNGKPIVVSSENWTEVEARFKQEGVRFWGWQRFQSSDGGDCIGVSVSADNYERAKELAEMDGGGDALAGYVVKGIVALFLLALLLAIMSGAMGG